MAPEKSRKQPWLIVGILLLLFLCMGGLLLPGKEMPEISMAPEKFHLFGYAIPNTLPTPLLTTLILLGVGLSYWRGVRRLSPTEGGSGWIATVDGIFETVYNFVSNIAGPQLTPILFPLVGTFFFFILTANWMGLLPGVGSIGVWEEHNGEAILVPLLRGADADLSVTLALALISFVAIQYFGFRFQGQHYLRKFFNFTAPKDSGALRPLLMFSNGFAGLLELISEFIKIFSFAFRLFGNVFAGEVLLIVISYLAAFVVSLPFMGLELFVGVVQALIFSMLSLIFFMMAAQQHGEEAEHHS
jgi:F-type H+-transporting ATPase subunit a